MDEPAQPSKETDPKHKESRLAYTLLVLLLVAAGLGYGIYTWQTQRADRNAMIELAESIELDSSGMAADKQARELVTARGWKIVDGYLGEETDEKRPFHRRIQTTENPGNNHWILHIVSEGQSVKGVFVRTNASMTVRPSGAPEDKVADKSKDWVKTFGG